MSLAAPPRIVVLGSGMSYVAGWLMRDGREWELLDDDGQYLLVCPGAVPSKEPLSEGEARAFYAKLERRTRYAQGTWDEWRKKKPR